MPRKCAGGCGTEIPECQKSPFKFGHARGCPSPPSDDDAGEAEAAEQPDAYTVHLTEAQIDRIWQKLDPGIKATAIDYALGIDE